VRYHPEDGIVEFRLHGGKIDRYFAPESYLDKLLELEPNEQDAYYLNLFGTCCRKAP
jgi:hypothetical protein